MLENLFLYISYKLAEITAALWWINAILSVVLVSLVTLLMLELRRQKEGK